MRSLLLVTLSCAIPLLLSAQGGGRRPPRGPVPPDMPESAPELVLPPDAPKLTPEQTANIIKQLDALDTQIGKNRGDILGGAVARFKKALANEKTALELYLECYKIEHFDRVNLKASDFQDWAKRNQDKHKDPEFLLAIWLQLEYLLLSIEAQDVKDKDIPTLVASIQSYIPKVVTAIQSSTKHTSGGAVKEKDPKGGPQAARGGGGGGRGGQNFDSNGLQGLLRESVKQSEFAKAFLVGEFLKRGDWTYEPADLGGMYGNIIFPYFLEKKPADLPALWDGRIAAEFKIRAAVMSESEYAVYYRERYPAMLWSKAEYLLSHNINTIQELAEMLKLIRDYPTHPDAQEWAGKLRSLVNAAQPPLLPSGATQTPAAADGSTSTSTPTPAPN